MPRKWGRSTLLVLVTIGLTSAYRRSRRDAPAPDVGPAEAALSLRLAEYQTMRQEIIQSLAAQQQILQWSLAAFAAFFAAGLVLVGQEDVDITSGTAGTLILVLFGLALPGIAIASCWSWLGELIRMERAGRYLRGYEKDVAQWCRGTGAAAAPLHWETLNAHERSAGRGLGRGKQQVGYFGSLLLYAGALGVSVLMFVIAVSSHSWHPETPQHIDLVLYGWAVVVLALFVFTGVRVVHALQAAGREAADLSSVDPATQSYPLPER